MKIGGSVFVKDAIRHDYCIEAAIESLVPLCDDIVVIDACSSDETLSLLNKISARHKQVRVFVGWSWECANDHKRLAILANEAIKLLRHDWHFMIQADEVLHEDSVPVIQSIIEDDAPNTVYVVTRKHIFRNMDYYIKHDLPENKKPSGDFIIRLGKKHHKACGDAQGLATNGRVNWDYKDKLQLFHYSYVRKNSINISRAIEMQSWFNGDAPQIDPRLLKMRDEGNVFKPEVFYEWDALKKLEINHPKVAQAWVNERRCDFKDEP